MSDGQELPEEYKKKELAAWNFKDFCERDFFNSGKTVNQAINTGINFIIFLLL